MKVDAIEAGILLDNGKYHVVAGPLVVHATAHDIRDVILLSVSGEDEVLDLELSFDDAEGLANQMLHLINRIPRA